jgi:HlyD family secretion protein
MLQRRWIIYSAAAAAILAFGWLASGWTRTSDPPAGFAKTNGRIEAERYDIATKFPGRIAEVLVREGDAVSEGQLVARLDTSEVEAQRREAEASVRQAERQLDQANALLAQRRSEERLARQQLERSVGLVGKGYTSQEIVDTRQAQVATAVAAIAAAEAQIAQSTAAIDAARARVARLDADLADHQLKAPRAGRVEYRLAQPGEVLNAGGKVVTVLDLTDVYMTVFLPTADAGRLALGSEARLIFDAAPQYVVPGTVSFVASDAQFTPRHVETKLEREKLMFRAKIQVSREVLAQHAAVVKAGIPGTAYVRVDRTAAWPSRLAVRLPGA